MFFVIGFQDCYIHNLKNQDIIFNSLHGGIGENGKIQAWMDKNEIKYTGSGSAASALCMDKARSKDLASIHGVKTAEWESLYTVKDKPTVGLPFVVKPNEQGSTIGLNIVNNESEIGFFYIEITDESDQIITKLETPITGDNTFSLPWIIPNGFDAGTYIINVHDSVNSAEFEILVL